MAAEEIYRLILATYGYPRIGSRVAGIFDTKEEALAIKDIAQGLIVDEWRIVRTDIEEHDELRGAVVAGCVPAEEQ